MEGERGAPTLSLPELLRAFLIKGSFPVVRPLVVAAAGDATLRGEASRCSCDAARSVSFSASRKVRQDVVWTHVSSGEVRGCLGKQRA